MAIEPSQYVFGNWFCRLRGRSDAFNIIKEHHINRIETSVMQMICVIDSKLEDNFTFAKMWETDKNAACREILRSVGHGVSFWDDYDPNDFGQSDHPDVGWFESPYSECYTVLTKFVAHIQQRLA